MAISFSDVLRKQRSLQSSDILQNVFPIGSFFITEREDSPDEILGFGMWERIENRMLIGAGDQFAKGSQGGHRNVTLTVNNLPSHNHTASTNDVGAHTHTRGTMNITGEIFSRSGGDGTYAGFVQAGKGAFTYTKKYDTGAAGWTFSNSGTNARDRLVFNASNTWTGETSSSGSHNHSVTVNNTGSGSSVETISPYLAVFIWKRVA